MFLTSRRVRRNRAGRKGRSRPAGLFQAKRPGRGIEALPLGRRLAAAACAGGQPSVEPIFSNSRGKTRPRLYFVMGVGLLSTETYLAQCKLRGRMFVIAQG